MAGTPLAAMAQQRVLQYAGVNLAGAEFKSSQKPGTLFKDYTYPSEKDFVYFASKGMNVVRLPFLWERLQPQPKGEFDPTQLKLLQKTVETASKHGISVLLDIHNYARYNGQKIGSDAVPVEVFTDLWTRLAREPAFANNPRVLFGLMNEPHDMGASDWAQSAQAAIDAIRAAGANNLILVPGTAWSGAHSWGSLTAGRGTSNGDALAKLTDPANQMVFEVHQYIDKDSSGTKPECGSDDSIGVRRLEGFTRWLREHGKTGFLGEFGASTDPTCLAALDKMLAYMQTNGDVWRGWSYWAAGGWWPPSYMFNVQPDKEGNDTPQMAVLSKYAREVTGAKQSAD
ncbi:glycoside hydrolase family 5 protein [Pseudoxanthomonas sp.]|uniref:glycoside hydrolase family 5 protein n=1 Tax=Pseudoxanthomonas sp. TaxID=1871049 RepID=UPI00260982DB|nr:glycoside hydrolase family 5 protein [Pseudoxanthomonas sp.]WDS38141.1 MAG: glycoside hydrolase family 5 protein [Pseudoxanthomonas sp.]